MDSKNTPSDLLYCISKSITENYNKIAFVCPVIGNVLYRDLERFSLRLAQRLSYLGVKSTDRVLIFQRRSAATIISMYAVLLAGGTYVPVAHGMPKERIQKIVSDSEPKMVICDATTLDVTREIATFFAIDFLEVEIDENTMHFGGQIDENFSVDLSNRAPCYLLYTSGSTGDPKGVIVSPSNVKDYADWSVSYFQITNQDTILSTAPFYFDMSTFDIYASLCSGATLVIASEKDCLFPKLLLKKLAENRVTVWKAVSSLFGYVSSVAKNQLQALSSLRILVFAGERLPSHFLMEWMDALPHVSYYNGYGPTEATGISVCYRIPSRPSKDENIPIGVPCTNTEVYLVDDKGEMILESNRSGEIIIGGAGVTLGYWRDQEKTVSRFRTEIADLTFPKHVYMTGDLGYFNDLGDLVFVARKDRQIKYQGYRIELDDIEVALNSLVGVVGAAAVLKLVKDTPELVAYYESESKIEDFELRSELAKKLPKYMVPKYLVYLKSIPRTDRGKIDYFALKNDII